MMHEANMETNVTKRENFEIIGAQVGAEMVNSTKNEAVMLPIPVSLGSSLNSEDHAS